ncbi:hypothetical protein LJ739_16205 [Aestuariibacter halophilus]|uniref:Uncharacterized protein n=1 Tax=Fluctibacter halophilus TaxID=226011 RepID=A0ABS8GB43_9ALTE|nr:hypothetical protein [Aestuariibacter halophilus]MCC2617795.1 hypothetical protein [Aestuariibacter halophilus]
MKRLVQKYGPTFLLELLSIVIAILLALAINQWANERTVLENNHWLLNDMYTDVEQELTELNQTIAQIEQQNADLSQYIADIEADPDTPERPLGRYLSFDRSVFWDLIVSRADLSLLEKDYPDLIRAVYSLQTLEDAVREHFTLMRKHMFTVCPAGHQNRLACLNNELDMNQFLIRLLELNKQAYQDFQAEYQRYQTH